VFVYLDDLLVASSSVEEHVLHVERVLERIREAGLRLKPEKCHFATQNIEYLGHTYPRRCQTQRSKDCSSEGVSVNPVSEGGPHALFWD